MRYVIAFLYFFFGMFLLMVFIQLLGVMLYWFTGYPNPRPLSLWSLLKHSWFPSLLFGIAGIIYVWDIKRQSKKPPRKRHPHD